jgi:hypothetical protein
MTEPEKKRFLHFSHNGKDTIYHCAKPGQFIFPFLVTTEYFPESSVVTETLEFIVDALNAQQAKADKASK